MANGITIKGLSELQARIKAAPANIKKVVGTTLKAGALLIDDTAKQNAPADQGFLKNFISTKQNDELNYEVVSGADYSAYVEFGTGTKVEIPSGLEEYAAQFKGGSDSGGLSAKEAIFAWCQRHAIDEKAWYAIYISIMTKGVKAQPFFFPALETNKDQIISDVKDALHDVI